VFTSCSVSVVDAMHSSTNNTLPVKGECLGVAETGGGNVWGNVSRGKCPTPSSPGTEQIAVFLSEFSAGLFL